jgi:hypothetical protein
MYIVPIAWLYVVVMMSMAEATSSNGTVLGAAITFVLYGLLPIALVMYLMGTPGRKRALRAKEAAERAAYLEARQQADTAPSGDAPDASSLPSADAISPVRKEP